MNRGNSVVAIDPGAEEAAPAEATVAEQSAPPEPAWDLDWDDTPEAARRPWGTILLGAAFAHLAIGWTGFFGWTNRAAMLAGAAPAQWIAWIRDWSIPLGLLGIAWLLLMRNSRREGRRFGEVAALLSNESANLEARLLTVNRELSLAREFLAAQARDIESLGRTASERISGHAERLAELVGENSGKLDTLATVSETALDNMEKLRSQLPVIASSAKDVTNNIGAAGRTAQSQIEDLVSGFKRINEFGLASEKQVLGLKTVIDQALGEFTRQVEQLDTASGARFAALTGQSQALQAEFEAREQEMHEAVRARAKALEEELAAARGALDGQEAESLVSLRARLTALRDESAAIGRSLREGESAAIEAWKRAVGQLEVDLTAAVTKVSAIDEQAMASARERLSQVAAEAEAVDARLAERDAAFAAEIARRREEIDARHADFQAQLASQMAELDAAIATRRAEQEDHSRRFVAHSETIERQLAQFNDRIAAIVAQGSEGEAALRASLAQLTEKLSTSTTALAETDRAVVGLTDSSVRLLELIQASVKHSREELPAALSSGEAHLAQLEARIAQLREAAGSAEQSGEALAEHVRRSDEALIASLGELERLHERIESKSAEQASALAEIRSALVAIGSDTDALAARAQGELRDAIAALGASAKAAVGDIEGMSADSIKALAARLGQESSAAIDAALGARIAEVAGALEASTAQAASTSREATLQLRDQLAKVNELVGNLERRVSQARARAEEQVDNDFARRVALITEALNSNAIDIARALDTEVTDKAWASYLKGDRGVFTRRAVKLLEPAEAKSVAAIYENDDAFRDHVSRYIHDFEAMLRQLLSTRDGHALGVTLLSSDMGKLYVALAQAIERLRS